MIASSYKAKEYMENIMHPFKKTEKNKVSKPPRVTLSNTFIGTFIDQPPPCFAVSYVQIGENVKGAFVIQSQLPLSPKSLQEGFCFAHKKIIQEEKGLLQVIFHFEEVTLQGFIPLSHPLIQSVLYTMIETKEIYFLILHQDTTTSVCQMPLIGESLVELQQDLESFKDKPYSETEYTVLVQQISHAAPGASCLTWVCPSLDHLDLTTPRLEIQYPIQNRKAV